MRADQNSCEARCTVQEQSTWQNLRLYMWHMDTKEKVETKGEAILDDIEDQSEGIIEKKIAGKRFVKIVKKLIALNKVIEVQEDIKFEKIKMVKQAEIDDVHIPIFDGGNYTSWEFRLLNILEYKE